MPEKPKYYWKLLQNLQNQVFVHHRVAKSWILSFNQKMADQGKKPIPEATQFLKYKPESLLPTIEEDNDGFIPQKRRKKSCQKQTKNQSKVAKRTAAKLHPVF
jgi:hypothetical protein